MKDLKAYRIAVKGLKSGIHHFQFEMDHHFFSCFEDAPFKEGQFRVDIEFDKRSDFYVLNFDIDGTIDTTCDRCTAKIKLPVQGVYNLIVKLEDDENSTDPDVIFLDPSADYLDLSSILYDFVNLSVPIHMVYDCQNEDPKPCDIDALHFLEESNKLDQTEGDNPIWDALKELKNHS